MRWLEEDVIERTSFLDTRIDAPPDPGISIDAAQVAATALPAAPIGWLFHTSFCASTLLARCLHRAPAATALKEPLVLRRLSDARHRGWPLDGLVAPAVALLARAWHPGGAVVLKPTHVALNIAGDLLAAAPGSRAVILTSSLPDFLISNLKKPPESQAKIPVLVERALRATGFAARLPEAALRPPDLVCAAGLQWAAQQELVRDVVAAAGPARVRVLDLEPLLANLPALVVACARWLQLPLPDDALAAHAREVGLRNAKATQTPYGPAHRAHEAGIVIARHGDALRRADDWLHTHVIPAMRGPAAPG
ncbi:MAG TPA: hypothetical protein VHW23_46400 [Kofleriaceae bacterium]|nr:hypothetical protein [Kofleriaceae bacterium]